MIQEAEDPSLECDKANALREMREAEAELRESVAEHREAEALEARAKAHEAEAIKRIEAAKADLERPDTIEIKIDGEDFVPKRRVLTANELMREFAGEAAPSKFYLVEIAEPVNVSFQGKGDAEIHLRCGMAFMLMALGPATVSDPNVPATGVAAFIAGLTAMGYRPRQLVRDASAVYFDYVVPAGPHKGREVRIGLIVPPSFPMTAPGGPYVSPRILPITGGGGVHPTGGIHAFDHLNAAGGEWEYWSRPCGPWKDGRKTVGAYMAHVANLWATL